MPARYTWQFPSQEGSGAQGSEPQDGRGRPAGPDKPRGRLPPLGRLVLGVQELPPPPPHPRVPGKAVYCAFSVSDLSWYLPVDLP